MIRTTIYFSRTGRCGLHGNGYFVANREKKKKKQTAHVDDYAFIGYAHLKSLLLERER